MACIEMIILKNRIKRTFYVEYVINSSEKEGTTNEISLSLDLNVKDGNNFCTSVSKPCLSILVCLQQYNSAGTSNLIVFIFSKICPSKLGVRLICGCSLYTDVYGSFVFIYLCPNFVTKISVTGHFLQSLDTELKMCY